MFERVRRSWSLMGEAWEVLRQDRELLVFPVVSGICSLLVMASFVTPYLLSIPWGEVTRGNATTVEVSFGGWDYVWLLLYYLATYFVVVFFNCALVACVRIRLAGGDPTVRDGFTFALANVGRIFQWALLSATVGTVLRTIEEHVHWLGQIAVSLIGVAWTLATAFVVPVLVHERVGPFEALKRSAQAFRKTWGETVVADIGLGMAYWLLFWPALLVVIAASVVAGMLVGSEPLAAGAVFIGGWLVCIAYWIALTIVHSTLQSIFLTACYQYATTGEVPAAFTPDHIVGAWRPKR
jgi:hypothetical protein